MQEATTEGALAFCLAPSIGSQLIKLLQSSVGRWTFAVCSHNADDVELQHSDPESFVEPFILDRRNNTAARDKQCKTKYFEPGK